MTLKKIPLKQQQDMATVVSLIANAKTVVKNDICLHVSYKYDELHSQVDKLET